MLRTYLIFWLIMMSSLLVTSAPLPEETHHVHLKIHVPKHSHTHHHTVVKKVYVPVKEKKHEKEEHKYFDDAW